MQVLETYSQIYSNARTITHCVHFLIPGGKGVKNKIKTVCQGLKRDSEKTWFAELSDKGDHCTLFHVIHVVIVCYII